MQGQGTFYDKRLDNAAQYPIAAAARSGHRRASPDLITSKLPALHFYQLAMPAPKAPRSMINAELASRGRTVFNGQARCATCHVPPIFTEPGENLHKASDIGIDDFQAERGPARQYVTTPLRALYDTKKLHKGGFYHDGRFATLRDVVNHYDRHLTLGLTDQQKNELIEYLRSL
jgi:cytochrome c peroxidase